MWYGFILASHNRVLLSVNLKILWLPTLDLIFLIWGWSTIEEINVSSCLHESGRIQAVRSFILLQSAGSLIVLIDLISLSNSWVALIVYWQCASYSYLGSVGACLAAVAGDRRRLGIKINSAARHVRASDCWVICLLVHSGLRGDDGGSATRRMDIYCVFET